MSKDVKEKVKAKITMMVVILGLMIGFNAYFKETTLVYLYDTVSFAAMIVLLFGVKKDAGRVPLAEERRKIYASMIGLVMGLTLVLSQFVPRPYSYITTLFGFGLLYYVYKGYSYEDNQVKSIASE